MALEVTDAIVLQAFPYGDTSRIVRLFTRSTGVQSAIAKGAIRPRSRFALMEPFAEGVAALHLRPGRDLQTLSGFDLTRARQAIGRDLLRFGGASLVAELLLRTASEEAQEGLYEATSRALDGLVQAEDATIECTVLAAAWHIVAMLGFAPALDDCIVCGTAVDAGVDASFDYAAGGLRCTSCAAGLPGRAIPPHARAALRAFSRGDVVRVAVTGGHWRLLSRYLEHHVLEGAPLRSLQFLALNLPAR
jgi:DNA repair protein RecO (recombination protein O)